MRLFRLSVGGKLALALSILYAASMTAVFLTLRSEQHEALRRHTTRDEAVFSHVTSALLGRPLHQVELEAIHSVVAQQVLDRRTSDQLVHSSFLWMGLVSGCFGLLGALLLARLVTAPIAQLRRDMLELATDGLPAPPAQTRSAPAFEVIRCDNSPPADGAPPTRGLLEGLLEEQGDELQQLRAGFELMVTELRRRNAQLVESARERETAQRLAEIGTMAATVAHEVRNPLNTIEGAIYYLRSAHGNIPDICEYTGLIEEQVVRLTRVTSHLLDASQPAERARVALDLGALARDAVMRVVREGSARKVDVELRLDPAVPPICGDRCQLEQVLSNLLENCLQAMDGNGKIVVETAMQGTDHVLLQVTDDGPGVRPENRDRIFEPFFTTRTTGTGLGLYIVSRILKAHGGSIELADTAGLGASFRVLLPLEAHGETSAPPASGATGESANG